MSSPSSVALPWETSDGISKFPLNIPSSYWARSSKKPPANFKSKLWMTELAKSLESNVAFASIDEGSNPKTDASLLKKIFHS